MFSCSSCSEEKYWWYLNRIPSFLEVDLAIVNMQVCHEWLDVTIPKMFKQLKGSSRLLLNVISNLGRDRGQGNRGNWIFLALILTKVCSPQLICRFIKVWVKRCTESSTSLVADLKVRWRSERRTGMQSTAIYIRGGTVYGRAERVYWKWWNTVGEKTASWGIPLEVRNGSDVAPWNRFW